MVLKTTAENIKSRMEGLTETVGEGEEAETVTILDQVVIGDYDTEKMPPGRVLSVRAVIEDGTLDFAGPNPDAIPFTVPWHLSLYVSGQISDATLEIYRLVPLIIEEIKEDMTFSGVVNEAYWAKPHVIFDEITRSKNKMISGARIIFMATYY